MSGKIFLNLEQINFFYRLLIEHTGLVIREQDRDFFSEKICQRIATLKLNSPEDYYQFLELESFDSRQEWNRLITLLTNNESYFFRDKQQFNLLRNELLPEIIQRNLTKKTIRICSAGCSTGQEPYSLAILLQELLPDFNQWNLLILGIDINQIALQEARKGIYAPWSFRGVGKEIKQKYFREIKNQYHLEPNIKKIVKFQQINLVKDAFPRLDSELKDMDLIICRNVFIYFEEKAIAKVINKMYHTLQPLGYLMTGHTELAGQDLSSFNIQAFSDSIVYRRPVENFGSVPIQTQSNIEFTNVHFPVETEKSDRHQINSSNQSTNLINSLEKIQQILTVAVEPNSSKLNIANPNIDREAIEEAKEYWRQKQHDLALEKLQEAIATETSNYEAYQLVAQIYADMGKYEEARD